MFEPSDCFVKAHTMLDKGQDHVLHVGINLSLARTTKLVAAPQEEQIHHEQCSAFVAVNKAVVGGQRLDQRSGFLAIER